MGSLPPLTEDAAGALDLLNFGSEALFVLDAQGQVQGGNAAWLNGLAARHLAHFLEKAVDPLAAAAARQDFAQGRAVIALALNWAPAGEAPRLGELHLAPAGPGRWLGRVSDAIPRQARPASEPAPTVSATGDAVDVRVGSSAPAAGEHGQELAAQTRVVHEQFELAMELAGLVIWHHDLAENVTHFNRQGAQLLGLEVRALPIERIREFIHPDDQQTMAQAVQEAIATRRPVDVVARYRQPDGHYRTLLTRRVVRHGDDGRPASVIGVGMDLTERLAERSQTQALTGRIELMVDSAGVGLWSVEPATGRAEWNSRMFEMYGLPEGRAPTLKHWMQHLVHPDDRERLRHERQRAHAAGLPVFETEFRIVRPDGGVRWVVCSSRREESQEGTMVFGTHLDVTERRQTEEALSQARERIMLATRGAGIAAWDRDLVRGKSYWDPQMYLLRGLSPDDPRSIRELRSCVHPDDLPGLLAGYDLALADPLCDTTNCEFRVIWPDGSEHWLATRGTIVRNEAGVAVRVLGVNWDVTERKQADQARRDKEAAEQASRAKSAFLARMSHELRTPLNAVLGFTQVLQADSPYGLTPGQRQKVDHIHTAGRHLLALIDDVLDLSRIESGALQLEQGPLDLVEVVNDALQLMGPMARRHDIAMAAAAVSGRVVADPRRLRQVLMNLLSNAIKYNRPAGRVEVSAVAGEREHAIVVRDTGRGMTPRQLAGLFEPFNRLGAERDGIEGTGIGLSIAQQLTQHMGGRLEVSSRPGQGSEFRLWLPSAPDGHATLAEARAVPPELPAAAAGMALSMLYIEDNEVNVLLVQELVALRPQIDLVCASDGLTGVAQALQRRPDVVLIDMHLPDIDGHEVLRRLRMRPELSAAKCIALSANAMPEDVAQALSEGFDDYWTKPIDVQRFLGALDALMAGAAFPGRADPPA